MGKRKQQQRSPELFDDDMATATRSAYDKGVDANKARNKRVLDALEAPELERPQKRCGP